MCKRLFKCEVVLLMFADYFLQSSVQSTKNNWAVSPTSHCIYSPDHPLWKLKCGIWRTEAGQSVFISQGAWNANSKCHVLARESKLDFHSAFSSSFSPRRSHEAYLKLSSPTSPQIHKETYSLHADRTHLKNYSWLLIILIMLIHKPVKSPYEW